MRILIVCSGNSGFISPFVKEQAESIETLANEILIYPIVGKGIIGYLKNIPKIKHNIRKFSPDIIHAHYGLSGLISSFVSRKIKLVVTYHGNDINPSTTFNTNKISLNRFFSLLSSRRSAFSILVNKDFTKKIYLNSRRHAVIPCGVNINQFYELDKIDSRRKLGLNKHEKYILFSSAFDNKVKNYELAKKAIEKINKINLVELKGYKREEVNLLLNACDIALLTSLNEGSPQFIKEAMATNCPIVATDVGDIKELTEGINGCFITSFNYNDVENKINKALDFSKNIERTNGRERIIHLGLDTEAIAKKIDSIYKDLQMNGK